MGSGLTETANDASIMHPDGFKELAGLLMCFSNTKSKQEPESKRLQWNVVSFEVLWFIFYL